MGERDPTAWVTDAVFMGEGLPDELYFEVILAAIDETGGDDELLWCIGDGPVDHLVGRDLVWGTRFHGQRAIPYVDRMFRTMQSCARQEGHDGGWWDDEFLVRSPRNWKG